MLQRYQRALELLNYDKATGYFTWKEDRAYRVKKGSRAGSVRSDGYRVLMIDGKPLYEHRAAWFFVNGGLPKDQIDHINRKKDDNRWVNLDSVTRKENSNNTKCQLRPNYGIHRVKATSKYSVKIRGITLGTFESIEKARKVRDSYVFSGI